MLFVEGRQSCAGGARAQLEQGVTPWGCHGEVAFLLNAVGHCPWSWLAKCHQALHKWLFLLLGFVTMQNKVSSVSCLQEGSIQYEEGSLSCAQRGRAVWGRYTGLWSWILPGSCVLNNALETLEVHIPKLFLSVEILRLNYLLASARPLFNLLSRKSA